jgi:hypothetical protein
LAGAGAVGLGALAGLVFVLVVIAADGLAGGGAVQSGAEFFLRRAGFAGLVDECAQVGGAGGLGIEARERLVGGFDWEFQLSGTGGGGGNSFLGNRILASGGGAGGLRREGALFGRGLLALRWGGFVFGHVGSMLRRLDCVFRRLGSLLRRVGSMLLSLGSVFRRATLVFGRLDSLFGRLDYVRFCLSGYGS